MSYLLVPRMFLILGLLLIPLLLDMYWQRVLCVAGVYALLALSFDFLAEFVGLVCLGGAFFIGSGGYVAGLLKPFDGLVAFSNDSHRHSRSGHSSAPSFSCPVYDLRGIYFAIVSFMFPLLTVYHHYCSQCVWWDRRDHGPGHVSQCLG